MARRSHMMHVIGRTVRIAFGVFLVGFTALAFGCASLERLPYVPLSVSRSIQPLNIRFARFYDDDTASMEALAREIIEKRTKAEGPPQSWPKFADYLAISGGGDDGAFGAGLLVGWTQAGTRPAFRLVTGTSTGALTAPFAFLGPDYDDELKSVYTTTAAEDVFKKNTLLSAVSDDAMMDTAPLRSLIARYLDSEMIRRIGAEYEKGRLLLIATTNLDQGRAVIWNIGAIAQSTDPRARELIIEILRASASIPGAFPPVMLDVTVDGKRYEEMHVDGGVVAQAFLYPPSLKLQGLAAAAAERVERVAYIIRNGRLYRPEHMVKRQTLNIAGYAISTMTAASGVNDTYRIYLTTQRDRVGFKLAYIEESFVLPYKGPFDKDYMTALFEHGLEEGKAGYNWHTVPPGYKK